MVLNQHAPPTGRDATAGVEALLAAPREAPPSLEWVVVTPAIAIEWLGRNRSNRRLKPTVANFYARQMREGKWRQDSPEPLIFDRDGNLINGQHRLEGVVRGDVPIRFLVARGVDTATRLSLDTGISRTGADALQIEYPETPGNRAVVYAAAIRGLLAWSRSPKLGPHEAIGTRLTNQELVDLFPSYREDFEVLYDAAEGIHQAGVHGGAGLWLIMLYRFSKINSGAALTFAEKVASGADLPERSPILTLRDRLNRMVGRDTKLRRQLVARLIALTWNAWREKRTLRKLILRDEADFPALVAR